jgi:hypothetical protein
MDRAVVAVTVSMAKASVITCVASSDTFCVRRQRPRTVGVTDAGGAEPASGCRRVGLDAMPFGNWQRIGGPDKQDPPKEPDFAGHAHFTDALRLWAWIIHLIGHFLYLLGFVDPPISSGNL